MKAEFDFSMSSLDEWREERLTHFAASLQAHAQRSLSHALHQSGELSTATSAASDRHRPPQKLAVSASTWEDLRLAARRAGAAEAFTRRKRISLLSSALRRPMIRMHMRHWHREGVDAFRGIVHWRHHSLASAVECWWKTYVAAIKRSMSRWLRRWSCVTRSAFARDAREERATHAGQCRLRRRVLSHMRKRAALRIRECEQSRARLKKYVMGMLRLWARVAATRARHMRSSRARLAMRTLRAFAVWRKRASIGTLSLALSRWRRSLDYRLDLLRRSAAMRIWWRRARHRRLQQALAVTLSETAVHTAMCSALQGSLARLLLHGWRQQAAAERRTGARLWHTERHLRRALKSWRTDAIRRAQVRATRRALRSRVPAPAAAQQALGIALGMSGRRIANDHEQRGHQVSGRPKRLVADDQEQMGQQSPLIPLAGSGSVKRPGSRTNFKVRREMIEACASPLMPLNSPLIALPRPCTDESGGIDPSLSMQLAVTTPSYLKLEPVHRAPAPYDPQSQSY